MSENKYIVITGVSSGIGYALCRRFIESGYNVYGSVRKEKDAHRIANELGDQFRPLILDITDYVAIESAVKKVKKEIGQDQLHGLINNAGIAVSGPLLHVPIHEIEHQFKVNVFGLMKFTQEFAPLLGAQDDFNGKPGRIIQISSVSGKVAMPFIGPYSASKHALEAISVSLRRELMLYGIDVIIIGPGAVKTPIWGKSAGDEIEKYMDTPYKKPLEKFQRKFVNAAIKSAFDVEFVTERIYQIFEMKKPKTRYALVSKKFSNYLIPQLLPDRFIDRFLGKAIGLIKR